MRISDWSSDVCSSDLLGNTRERPWVRPKRPLISYEGCWYSRGDSNCRRSALIWVKQPTVFCACWSASWEKRSIFARRSVPTCGQYGSIRSEEHTSELQSLMRISYAVLYLKKTQHRTTTTLT